MYCFTNWWLYTTTFAILYIQSQKQANKLIFYSFCNLPSQSQVPNSLLRLYSKAGLFCPFLLQCIVPPTHVRQCLTPIVIRS